MEGRVHSAKTHSILIPTNVMFLNELLFLLSGVLWSGLQGSLQNCEIMMGQELPG